MFIAVLHASLSASAGGDWGQWRGPDRAGVAADSPALIEQFPVEGLKPAWISKENLRGGWSSPVVFREKVFLYTHTRERNKVELPPAAFPVLTEEQQESMPEEEQRKYEEARAEESRERQKQQFSFHDTVHCLHAETGEPLWRQTWPGRFVQWGQSSTPAAVDDTLYVVGSDRRLHALHLTDGEPLWQADLSVSPEFDQPISSSIAVVDGVGIVLANRLVGIDLSTGKMMWELDPERFGGVHSSPVIWRGGESPIAIVNVRGGKTVAVEPATGRELWRVETHAEKSTPVVVGDRLLTYANSRKGGLRCFRISESGADEEWLYRRVADPGASPVATQGLVIVPGDKALACVDLETGEGRWLEQLDLAQSQYTSPIAADGQVFYSYRGLQIFRAAGDSYQPIIEAKFGPGGLVAAEELFRRKLDMKTLEQNDPQKAEQTWQREVLNHGPVDCTSPALADGRLYLRLQTGLACYDLRKDRRPATARISASAR